MHQSLAMLQCRIDRFLIMHGAVCFSSSCDPVPDDVMHDMPGQSTGVMRDTEQV